MKTAEEYSGASSVHGVAYVFDKEHGALPRFAWLLIVLSGMTLGIYWSVEVGEGTVIFGYYGTVVEWQKCHINTFVTISKQFKLLFD